jgi:hypothetical protein
MPKSSTVDADVCGSGAPDDEVSEELEEADEPDLVAILFSSVAAVATESVCRRRVVAVAWAGNFPFLITSIIQSFPAAAARNPFFQGMTDVADCRRSNVTSIVFVLSSACLLMDILCVLAQLFLGEL